MSVMTSFTLRSLSKNRVRTAVSIIGIVLSVALITGIWASVSSIQKGLYDMTLESEGWWHASYEGVADSDIQALVESDSITDVVTAYNYGVALFSQEDRESFGAGLVLQSSLVTQKGALERDGYTITALPEITEGRMAESQTEIVLPDWMRSIEFTTDEHSGILFDGELEVGTTLTLDLAIYQSIEGIAYASSDTPLSLLDWGLTVLDKTGSPVEGYGASTAEPDEEFSLGQMMLVAHQRYEFTVVGFYDDIGTYYPVAYTGLSSASSVAGSTSTQALEPTTIDVWVATQGLTLSSEIYDTVAALMTESFDPDIDILNLHYSLLRYSGISTDSLLENSLYQVAAILAIVVGAASVSLIYTSFSISVAERTRQFGLLASLGASKRQLRRSVLVEALMLGAIGIPLGLICGLLGTAGILALTKEGFTAMGLEGLTLAVYPIPLAIAAFMSLIVLLISAWVPAIRAARVSAVDAIRRTQDVHLPKRIERRAARSVDTSGIHATRTPFSRGRGAGLWGLIAGVPGILAHRNLSRQSARGRTVVASLAVSVVLVVVCGNVAHYFSLIASAAGSSIGVTSDTDVVAYINADVTDLEAEYNDFIEQASRIEGAQLEGVVGVGYVEVVIPAELLTQEGTEALSYDEIDMAEWVPSSIGSDGSYYGSVYLYFLDDSSWASLVDQLGLDAEQFQDPLNPRAIALNTYQSSTDQGSLLSVQPFAQTGTITLYYAIDLPGTYRDLGVMEGEDGQTAIGVVNDEDTEGYDDPVVEYLPADEVASSLTIEIAGLTDEEPGLLNVNAASQTIPVFIMPDAATSWYADGDSQSTASQAEDTHDTTAAETADASSSQEELSTNPFISSLSMLQLSGEDHLRIAEDLTALAEKDFAALEVSVTDITSLAQNTRLSLQAIQIFILCFTAIMVLIAIANVFNTLTNSIMLRTREFAMLKSAGMDDRSFSGMLICECASYALRGLAIGIILSALLSYAFYDATALAFLGQPFSLPWNYVAAAVGLVLMVLALSVAFALHRSHATEVVEALRTDAV